MVMSCITAVQCQNRDLDIGIIHRAYLHFTSFMWTHLCVFLCKDSCNYWDTELFYDHKVPLRYPLVAAYLLLSPTALTVAASSLLSCLYDFVLSRMSYKWNHKWETFWDWHLQLAWFPGDSSMFLCVSIVIFFYWCVVFHGIYVLQFPLTHWRTFFPPSFWLLWIKLVWIIMYRFLCEHKFSFLWDQCPRMQLLGHK